MTPPAFSRLLPRSTHHTTTHEATVPKVYRQRLHSWLPMSLGLSTCAHSRVLTLETSYHLTTVTPGNTPLISNSGQGWNKANFISDRPANSFSNAACATLARALFLCSTEAALMGCQRRWVGQGRYCLVGRVFCQSRFKRREGYQLNYKVGPLGKKDKSFRFT